MLALRFLLGICLCSPWSPPLPVHALDLILLSLATVRFSPTLTFSPLIIWYSGQTALFLSLFPCGSGILAICSLCGTEATLSFSAGSVCSSFSAEAYPFCTLFVSAAPTSLPFLLSSPIIWLSSCPHHPVLSSVFPFISNSVADLAGTVFSLLLFYQSTMGPRTLVSPGERRGR